MYPTCEQVVRRKELLDVQKLEIYNLVVFVVTLVAFIPTLLGIKEGELRSGQQIAYAHIRGNGYSGSHIINCNTGHVSN